MTAELNSASSMHRRAKAADTRRATVRSCRLHDGSDGHGRNRLISASAKLLKAGGDFAPSFIPLQLGHDEKGMERHDIGGELVEEYFVRVSRYSQPIATKGRHAGPAHSAVLLPSPPSALLNVLSAGFVLDAAGRPSFGANADRQSFRHGVSRSRPLWSPHATWRGRTRCGKDERISQEQTGELRRHYGLCYFSFPVKPSQVHVLRNERG